MDNDINLFELNTNVSLGKLPYSASVITWLARNQTVCIKSDVDPYSDTLGQTMFLGFRLDQHVMNSLKALQLLLFHKNGVIHIVQNLNSGMHWVSSNNSVQFSFPTGGIYLTNLCIKFVGWGGIVKQQILPWNHTLTLFETYVSLKYSNNPVKKVIASYVQYRAEVLAVVASVSRILFINTNDKMTMDYMLPNNAEVSVQFILFSPRAGQKVIWSLKYSQILPTKVNGLTADIIEGAAIINNDELVILQEGIYYVSLSAYVVCSHLISIAVKKGDEYIVSFGLPIYGRDTGLSSFTFNKANLAHLKRVDKLLVNMFLPNLVEEEIYFAGFLLYPTI